MHRQEVPEQAKEATDGVRERIAEAELWKEYLTKFADDRIATLRSAVGDGQTGAIDDSQRVLEGLNWSKGRKNPSWEWTFNTDREGNQLSDTDAAAKLIENAKDHKLKIGGYEYSISIDRKFLNRRRAK